MNKPIPKLPYNIYWINLDRRPDRKEHMKTILVNNKDNNFRISAIDYKNNFKPYTIIGNSKINAGEHGCISSHIKALHYFLNNSVDKYCFIAEDDLSNIYSEYWQEKHYNYLQNSNYDILQLQTTSNVYNNKNMTLEKMQNSGTTFYRIKRNIAEKIVKNHFYEKNLTINLSNFNHPVADRLLWSYGIVYLLPMFSYVNVEDSETNPENINLYWKNFFQNAKNKYLNYWKEL